MGRNIHHSATPLVSISTRSDFGSDILAPFASPVESVDVVNFAVPGIRNHRQTPQVTLRVRRKMFDSPSKRRTPSSFLSSG